MEPPLELEPTASPPDHRPFKQLPPLTTLPNELILLILQLLDHWSVNAVLGLPDVSKRFRNFNRLYWVITDAPERTHFEHMSQVTNFWDKEEVNLFMGQREVGERVIIEITNLCKDTINKADMIVFALRLKPVHLSIFYDDNARSPHLNTSFDLPCKTATYETLTRLHLTNTTVNTARHHFPSLRSATFAYCGVEPTSTTPFLDAPLLVSLTLKGYSAKLLMIFDFANSSIRELTLCEIKDTKVLGFITCPTLYTLNIINCEALKCQNLDLETVHDITITTSVENPGAPSFELSGIYAPVLEMIRIDTAFSDLSIHDVDAPTLRTVSWSVANLRECYNVSTPKLEQASIITLMEFRDLPSPTMDLTWLGNVTRLNLSKTPYLIRFTPRLKSLFLRGELYPDLPFHVTPHLEELTIFYTSDTINTLPFSPLQALKTLKLENAGTIDTGSLARVAPNLESLTLRSNAWAIQMHQFYHDKLKNVTIHWRVTPPKVTSCFLPMLRVFELSRTIELYWGDTLPLNPIELLAPSLESLTFGNVHIPEADLSKYPKLTTVSITSAGLKSLTLNAPHLQTLDVSHNMNGVDAIVSPPLNSLREVKNSCTPRLGWEPLDCLLLSPILQSDKNDKNIYVSGYAPKRGCKRELSTERTDH